MWPNVGGRYDDVVKPDPAGSFGQIPSALAHGPFGQVVQHPDSVHVQLRVGAPAKAAPAACFLAIDPERLLAVCQIGGRIAGTRSLCDDMKPEAQAKKSRNSPIACASGFDDAVYNPRIAAG